MNNKLKEIENSAWNFIEKNKRIIFLIIITVFALILRIRFFNIPSGDYDMFLQPWFNQLKAGGGLYALGKNIGNYTAPYMTIMALLTYLPISSLSSIKAVSVIFDFVCAITATKIADHVLKNNKHKDLIKILIYSMILFLPTIFLNSSYWGQADSIYTAFVLISILYLLKEKYIKTFVFLGIAFSFKLQAIFILPLYILMYISERKFSIINFLIPIITTFVMCLPSIIFGNSIGNCINIYIGQTETYSQYITLNLPNVYSIFFKSGTSHLIEVGNNVVGTIGIMLTIFSFMLIAMMVLYKKVKFDNRAIIEFGLWSILICTFLLPQMHERYLFMGDILSLLYLIWNKRKYYIPIAIEFISLYGYTYLLFSAFGLEMMIVGIAYLVLIVLYSKEMIKKYFFNYEKTSFF